MAYVDLRFRADRSFTIAQFTDLHWQDGGAEDQATAALMHAVLEAERPDLAVLTGDLIAGREAADPAAAFRGAVAPLLARGVPWAFVFGNHDDEGRLSRADLLAVAQGCGGCLAEAGPSGLPGVGNYRLAVGDGTGALAAHLYFLDSGAYAPADVGGYAWVTSEQVAWYRALAREGAAARGAIPALAFLHIPLPEYRELWESQTCRGVRHEDVCCPKLNSGLFTAFHDGGDVVGVFVGHDHTNDYEGTLWGVRLGYGRASGYHTYGREGMARGARMIRMALGERALHTWLRLDDGRRVDPQREHRPLA